jgi:5'/3'-nucleotidase SurE
MVINDVECLLTNDDGPGLLLPITVDILRALFGSKLLTAIPSRDRIATSSALTPTGLPISVQFDPSIDSWVFGGLPADCVRYFLHDEKLTRRPRYVVSGINHGFNLGRCVLNSGTVGGALEATRYGISAVAVSTDQSIETVSHVWKGAVASLLRSCFRILDEVDSGPVVLNVNLPPKAGPVIDAVFFPVSAVEYDEWYDEDEVGGMRRISRGGRDLVPDPEIQDLKMLSVGRAVINILPSPWTVDLNTLRERLATEFPS